MIADIYDRPSRIRLGNLVTSAIKHPCPNCGHEMYSKESKGYIRRSCASHGVKESEKVLEPPIYGCFP